MPRTPRRPRPLRALRRLAQVILDAAGHQEVEVPETAGPLASLLGDELAGDTETRLDVADAAAAFQMVSRETVCGIVSALADVAAADGGPSPPVRDAFMAVVRILGLPDADGEKLLASAMDAPPIAVRPSCAGPSTQDALDDDYLEQVARFDPVAMGRFGAEFAALAVHRLSDVTLLYELQSAACEQEIEIDIGYGSDTAYQLVGSNPRESGEAS